MGVYHSKFISFGLIDLHFAEKTCRGKNHSTQLLEWIQKRFEYGCDVIAIQNAHNFNNQPGIEEIKRIFHDAGIDYIATSYEEQETKKSMYLITCWNNKKVQHIDTIKTVFNTPNRDHSFLTSNFIKNGQEFTFVNINFPTQIDEKNTAIQQFIENFIDFPFKPIHQSSILESVSGAGVIFQETNLKKQASIWHCHWWFLRWFF